MNTGIIHNKIYVTRPQSQIQSSILPSTASYPSSFIINIPNTQNRMTLCQIPTHQTQQNIVQPSPLRLSHPGCYSNNILIGNETNIIPFQGTQPTILNAQQLQQSLSHYMTHSMPTTNRICIAQTCQAAPDPVLTNTCNRLNNPTINNSGVTSTPINQPQICNANILCPHPINHNVSSTPVFITHSQPALLLNNLSLPNTTINSETTHCTPVQSTHSQVSTPLIQSGSNSDSMDMGTFTLPNISSSLPPALEKAKNVALNEVYQSQAMSEPPPVTTKNIEILKRFPCKYCHKRFNRKSNMKKHVLIHTRERMFKCTHCTKSFTQKHTYVTIIVFCYI